MKSFLRGAWLPFAVALALLPLGPPPRAAVTLQVPAGSSAVRFKTALSSAVTLTGTGTACTSPGGASCTVILSSTDVSAWEDWTLYVNVSGAATVDNLLIEVSPDGTSWTELNPRGLDGWVSGSNHTVNVIGHYAYVRVEARAATTSAIKVAMSGAH